MLSSKQLEKVRRFEGQYGPGEDSFSPDWHARNPGPGPDAAPVLENIAEGRGGITVKIQRILLPSGDITLDNTLAQGWTLPEGAKIVD